MNIEFDDFNDESAYRIFGLWESIDDAKGGPFQGIFFMIMKMIEPFI